MEGGGIEGKRHRGIAEIASTAAQREIAGIAAAAQRESAITQRGEEEFEEFPEVARMTAEERKQRLEQLGKDREAILAWGDLTGDDHLLLEKISGETEAIQRAIAAGTAPGEGVRHGS